MNGAKMVFLFQKHKSTLIKSSYIKVVAMLKWCKMLFFSAYACMGTRSCNIACVSTKPAKHYLENKATTDCH